MQSYNAEAVKDLDDHKNVWILYTCLAVISILAVILAVAFCSLIYNNRQLSNDLADIKNALRIPPTSPNGQSSGGGNLHDQNPQSSSHFSPNLYYGSGDDQNRVY